mmetsp:Transcript_62576/g.146831  ORF Transcript_62576/g.146831 Transcript_62576/m.146831 type:complete len:910 (+) Transcript_62576:173-2902(+)
MLFFRSIGAFAALAAFCCASPALEKDDACLSSESGSCGFHALQVGLGSRGKERNSSNSSGMEITIGLTAQDNSKSEPTPGLEKLKPVDLLAASNMYASVSHVLDLLKQIEGLKRPLWQLNAGTQMGRWDMRSLIPPQPDGVTQDQWFTMQRNKMLQDPGAQVLLAQRKRRVTIGMVILTILSGLVVMIEVRKKNASPYETKVQTSLKITQKELSEHNTTSSLWISIGGVVCDVTDFLMLHPGGNDVLLQHGGTEAYEAFEEVGHSDFARKMVHEKAIGLLTDGVEAPRTGAGVSLVGRLFTKEDAYNLHKSLGIFILCHTFYRIYTACDMQLDGGFTSEWSSLGLCWVSMVLQTSSFLFEVPRARLLGSPMIWQEWRAHNLVFVGRHVLAFTICWGYLRWVNFNNDEATFFVEIALFAVLYGQLYSVDVITAYIREDKHTSLTASWPFWDGCPLWLESAIKFYYTIAQFQASSLLIMTGSSLFDKYMVIFPFQFASFLMTLVRKGIITTKGFHAGYLWSLWMVVWLILGPQDMMTGVSSFAFWILLYVWRSYGLSKYALWFGPLLAKGMAHYRIIPSDGMLEQFGIMMLTWLVCMGLQRCAMGFATELRARRFLEARQKPLKLLSKEKISDTFVLLKFEVPSGYTAGINPGQHVKVHVPNSSKGFREWNKATNLEQPVEILSRSYTPVSATTSPTLDLMVRHYPKNAERGFPDGGRASTYLVETLAEGNKVLMSGPHGHQLYFGQGNFLVGKNMVKARVCGALAGGSGITPVLATLRDIWQEGRRDVRDRDQRILGEQALKMKEFAIMHVTRSSSEALAPSWYTPPEGFGEQTPIRVSHVITGSDSAKAEVPGAVNCWTGRVTEDMVSAAMPSPGDDVVIFVCGPQGFSEQCCRPILNRLGYKHVVMLQ